MIGERAVVAVVGRPNVGKSTLVNRFVGRRDAIVQEEPGVTRDRRELEVEWAGREFVVVDTGGWLAEGAPIDAKVSRQAERAIADADLVLLVGDVTVGVTDEDERVARLLHRTGTPVLVVVNKVDDTHREQDLWPFAALGFGDPVPVSALHGRGSGDLLDAVVAALPAEAGASDSVDAGGRGVSDHGDAPATADPIEVDEAGNRVFSVAIVGRPNVGKSTLFNRLVGDERSIVHDAPGTTRDAIDTLVDTPDGPLRFVDTAGMRRRSRIDEPTEYFSMLRALEAVDRADAAIFVIDATQGATHQDQRLAERIDGAGSPVVIVLNKWDLVPTERREQVRIDVADRMGFLDYAPVLELSALTGRRTQKLLPALRAAEEAYHRRIPTAALNRVLREAQAAHPPPIQRKHRPRVLYATQGAADPPTFTLFTTRQLPATYLRYLERRIREAFDLGPSPIKIRVRPRSS